MSIYKNKKQKECVNIADIDISLADGTSYDSGPHNYCNARSSAKFFSKQLAKLGYCRKDEIKDDLAETGVRMLNGFIRLRTGFNGRTEEHGNETLLSIRGKVY
jgi:hypothetical protein